jgi:hypothetical protein
MGSSSATHQGAILDSPQCLGCCQWSSKVSSTLPAVEESEADDAHTGPTCTIVNINSYHRSLTSRCNRSFRSSTAIWPSVPREKRCTSNYRRMTSSNARAASGTRFTRRPKSSLCPTPSSPRALTAQSLKRLSYLSSMAVSVRPWVWVACPNRPWKSAKA